MFLSEWREYPSTSCLEKKKKLMTAHVSMLLKSRASLTCFRTCFLPGRAKDLSAPRYVNYKQPTEAKNNAILTEHFESLLDWRLTDAREKQTLVLSSNIVFTVRHICRQCLYFALWEDRK
jgi:hypothetical protein